MNDEAHFWITLTLSIVAVTVSLVAIGLQFFIHWRENRQNALATNIAALAEVELVIARHPEVLRFHSISEADLEAHGLTAVELSYLLANFHIGSTYYSTIHAIPTEESFTATDAYRYFMMKSPATRKAWPLIERFMIDSNYKTRLRLTALDFDNADKRTN